MSSIADVNIKINVDFSEALTEARKFQLAVDKLGKSWRLTKDRILSGAKAVGSILIATIGAARGFMRLFGVTLNRIQEAMLSAAAQTIALAIKTASLMSAATLGTAAIVEAGVTIGLIGAVWMETIALAASVQESQQQISGLSMAYTNLQSLINTTLTSGFFGG